MSAWKYKNLTPKVIVEKLRLIPPNNLIDLCGRNLEEISTRLANTQYQQEIKSIPSEQHNALTLENALLQNFIRIQGEIKDCSPRKIRSLLSTMQMRFDAGNIKAMLRAKKANLNLNQALELLAPAGKIDQEYCRKKLEKSENVANLVENLSDTEYGKALKTVLADFEETDITPLLEAQLDKYVYGKIWKAAGRLGGLDRKIATDVLGCEIDSLNVKAILRCKVMKISGDAIKRCLIPSSDVITLGDLEMAVNASDAKSAIASLLASAKSAMSRDHQYMLSDVLNEFEKSQSLAQTETVIDRSLLKTSLRMVKRYTQFFNIGFILAFLNLKWFEVRNLRAIIKGAEERLPPDRIRKLLILP